MSDRWKNGKAWDYHLIWFWTLHLQNWSTWNLSFHINAARANLEKQRRKLPKGDLSLWQLLCKSERKQIFEETSFTLAQKAFLISDLPVLKWKISQFVIVISYLSSMNFHNFSFLSKSDKDFKNFSKKFLSNLFYPAVFSLLFREVRDSPLLIRSVSFTLQIRSR